MACLLCNLEETEEQNHPDGRIFYDCRKCGRFFKISLFPINIPEEIKHLVSGYTRELKEVGNDPPPITEENANLFAKLAPTKIIEKIDRILFNIANKCSYPAEDIHINPEDDYPLGYCKNTAEFNYFLRYLTESNLLIYRPPNRWRLTVQGWERVDNIQKTSATSSQVFVAMNFDGDFDTCYEEGIKLALEETNYRPYRIDREEHADKIDDKILSEIKRSRFIIAEFTGQRHGVYFEAGYALGLGIPVIWTCKEDDLGNLHFDTRQYNHIAWSSENDLKEKLINRIRVLIGEN